MATPAEGIRPITMMVSAIGGEGGGVLAGWIVAAAQHAGYPVQSTSIPGVAQRTGATVYYLEVFPVPLDQLGGRAPVLAIYPGVGDIDVMIASEMAEAGRAIANGFITPDRTTLIASTHRVYTIGERTHGGEGRFDPERLAAAIDERARIAWLSDLRALAEENKVSLNAVLLGILAAGDLLPVPRVSYEAAIRSGGIAVDANLKGFEIGLGCKFENGTGYARPAEVKRNAPPTIEELEEAAARYPVPTREIIVEAVRRLSRYQDSKYAGLFLDRLDRVKDAELAAGGSGALTAEAGRLLAVGMSYEDIIRVAQLKTDPARQPRIRSEIRAAESEPFHVYDFFKPGLDEFCALMPSALARLILKQADGKSWKRKFSVGLKLRSTTIFGFTVLRLLSGLRWMRRTTYGYACQQERLELWLDDICAAAKIDLALAQEIVACAELVKGYGDTFDRGAANVAQLRQAVIRPALAGDISPSRATDLIANARAAIQSDPEGDRLALLLDDVPAAAE